jgi:uncharacterized protein (TIGR03000 family)
MIRPGYKLGSLAVVTAAALSFTAGPGLAGGGGGHGGGGHGGGFHGGGHFHGSHFGGHNHHGHGGFFVGVGFYGGFYPGYYGYPYAGYYGYPYYGGAGYWPPYPYGPDAALAVPGAYPGPLPPAAYPAPPPPDASAAPANNAVHVSVRVPAGTEVWFNGVKMSPTGVQRQFVSPALTAGQEYRYEVRAEWVENGRAATRTRQLTVHAGDRINLDWTAPSGPTTLYGAANP